MVYLIMILPISKYYINEALICSIQWTTSKDPILCCDLMIKLTSFEL